MQPRTVTRKMTASLIVTSALAVLLAYARVERPPWFDAKGELYILAALAAAAGVTLLHLISFFLLDVLFRKRKGSEAPQLIRMVVAIAGYAAIFIAVYYGVLGRNLGSILTTSAVLSVILGLALQDTLGNFFAGISIQLEQPFHIGDALRVGDVLGRVESVTWRATTVRTNDNSAVILPNSRIARDAIEVYRLHSLNRRLLRIPAPYDISPETVIGLARDIASSMPKISREKPPEARIAEFSDSSVTYEILYWIDDYLWAHEVEAAIRERLWYAFHRRSIEIPFPVRHVVMETRRRRAETQEPEPQSILAAVEILKPLNAEELNEVERGILRRLYAPGETVLRTGDAGDSMFVICRGSAEVLGTDAEGNLRRVAVLNPQDVIGEMALFTGEPRRADVRALEELEILEIRKGVMQMLLHSNAALADAFSQIIAARQSQLSALAEAHSVSATTAASASILQKIRKFFNLR